MELCAGGAGVQSLVPDGDDEVGVGEGQGAGEVHGIGAAQGVGAGQLAGVAFDGCGELDGAYRGPVLFPVLLRGVQVELTAAVERHAGQLARSHTLRGADAVHLASALALADPDLIIAVWDRRLHAGAVSAQLRLAPAHLPAT